MGKWIAEFDLEDGDTMPEHMDLKYKGAKIDFYCKPLEQELCEDCISRKDILQILWDYDYTNPNALMLKEIMELPLVTPIRPKGHWIGNYQVDFGEWQEYDVKLSDGFVTDNCHCSECGEELLSGDRGMFCPYCGADMREVVEE